jgi:pilus assembly protein TadC
MEVAAVHCGRRLPPALDASVRALHLGATLDEALADSVRREPVLAPLADVLATSARLGVPATPSLARLGSEVRADVRRRAEARARAVPVTLLFPLVLCVLPAFALLTVVPALIDGLGA